LAFNLPAFQKYPQVHSETALYIEMREGYTPKGDIEEKIFLCYLAFSKKETSCKEIRVSSSKLKILNRRFLMNEEDRTRLEEFRQFRREVRGSAEYLIVGIDVAKDKHHAFFGTAMGKTLFRRLVFENNLEGFQKLLAQAEAMKGQEGLTKVVFGMEPPGNYHIRVYELHAMPADLPLEFDVNLITQPYYRHERYTDAQQ
jgi:hypothetical protein